jgi:hypothetical protein
MPTWRTRPQVASFGAVGPLDPPLVPPVVHGARGPLGVVPLAGGRHRLCGLRALMLAVNRAIMGEQLGDADNLRTEH